MVTDMKTNIVYSNNQLLVNLEGDIAIKDCENLKQKIYGIVNEYGISDVVFDVKNSNVEEKLLQELQTDFIHVIIHK